MFENLTQKFLETFRIISGRPKITEQILDEVCRQLRTLLLEADVNVKVIKDFVQNIREKVLSTQKFEKSMNAEQHFIRVVYKELAQIMGEKFEPLNFQAKPPAVFLLVGLQGTGKTTSILKLANYLKEKEKKSIMAVSVDIYRPAAIEQLNTLMTRNGFEHFNSPILDSVRERALLAKEEAIRKNLDVLLIDTAGRLHIDTEMMDEISDLVSLLSPAETLLVLDAMTGQDAVKVAVTFNEKVPLSGIILTKMDGDARGGAALSIRAVTGCPIKFIGTGEKAEDWEVFYPDRLASRILDMGDLLSLAEKAKTVLDKEESIKLVKKIKKNDFTLADFYFQLQQIKKIGSFENILKFMPGVGKFTKELENMSPPDDELKKIEAIILSMTPEERGNHAIIDGSRRKRIAKGSGTEVQDVNRLLKQFLEARKIMNRFANSSMGKRRPLW